MQQPPQKPITYFIVQPEQFQAVCNRLGTLPYGEVAGLLQDFVGTSRAMFDPLPGNDQAPGARVPNDYQATPNGSEPPAGEKGNGSAEPAATPAIETLPDDQASPIVEPDLDKRKPGGAK